MAEASAEHPEARASGFGLPRRVVTAPVSMSRPSPAVTDALVETLYNHPNAKIVSFITSYVSSVKGDISGQGGYLGALPWSSPAERTIAVGPFRIYRARGSVAFLNCGSALQPILPKSQCWCIDETNSKFVLQIRKPNYWRIELPVDTGADQARAESFKGILNEILQFEKTECPFQRSFTVQLPTRPTTPTKKKAWTPRQGPADGPVDLTTSLDTQSVRPMPIWNDKKPAPNISLVPSPLEESMASHITTETLNSLPLKSEVPTSHVTSTVELIDASTIGQIADDFVRRTSESHPEEHVPSENHDATTDKLPPLLEDATTERSSGATLPDQSPVVPARPAIQVNRSVSACDVTLAASPEDDGSRDTFTAGFGEKDSLQQSLEGAGSQGNLRKTKLRRTAGFAMRRSATSPSDVGWKTTNNSTPSLPLQARRQLHRRPPIPDFEPRKPSHIPSTEAAAKAPEPTVDVQPASSHASETSQDHCSVRSEDSFHSMESWRVESPKPVPSPPSRPDSPEVASKNDHITVPRTRTGSKSRCRLALPGSWEETSNDGSQESHDSVTTPPDALQTATQTIPAIHITRDDGAGSSSLKVPQQTLRHRASADSISLRRRALSPLPSAASLFMNSTSEGSPYRSRLGTVSRIPFTIIAKTAEILLGPPSHLLILMLKVAAKIISGQWRGRVYGYDENGEQIPVQWDYSEGDFSDWSDDEDVDVESIRERRSSFRTDGGDVE